MMSWAAYRLVYQAKSPIHIGWHTLGYIKLTRYYVTGKNMWGAITANITRTYGNYQDMVQYTTFGELLKKDILASYFYPAIYKDKNLHLMLPKYTENGLRYGEYTRGDFERIFISSYGQTAVLPESNTAEDETLHESEYISPMAEGDGEQQHVYFVGYVFIKDDAKTVDGKTIGWDNKNIRLKEVVSEIFVGSDRKYGWGRLVLKGYQNIEETDNFFGYTLKLSEDRPMVTIEPNEPVPAHVPINDSLTLKGDIEPLVGREWGEVEGEGGKKIGAGQVISKAEICWVPGSVLQQDKAELQLRSYGILKQRV